MLYLGLGDKIRDSSIELILSMFWQTTQTDLMSTLYLFTPEFKRHTI